MSTDAKKAFDKIQHPFMQKLLNKVSKEGINLNIIKAMYDKLTSYWMVKTQKLSLRNLEWDRDAFSPLLFNIVWKSYAEQLGKKKK